MMVAFLAFEQYCCADDDENYTAVEGVRPLLMSESVLMIVVQCYKESQEKNKQKKIRKNIAQLKSF